MSVGVSTVRDFEAGRREPTRNNLAAMKAALEKGGIAFVDDDKQLGIVAPRYACASPRNDERCDAKVHASSA